MLNFISVLMRISLVCLFFWLAEFESKQYAITDPFRHEAISSLYSYASSATNITSANTNTNNVKCSKSEFIAVFGGCCLQQFRHQYLVKLGFENGLPFDAPHQISKIRYKYDSDNDNDNEQQQQQHIGCYGLNIRRVSLMHYLALEPIYQKSHLYETIANYARNQQKKSPQNANEIEIENFESFLPKTYHMRKQNERIEFFGEILNCNITANNNWIFKQNMHQGYGIEFIDNQIQFRKLFLPISEQKLIDEHCVVGNIDPQQTSYITSKNYQILNASEFEFPNISKSKTETDANLNLKMANPRFIIAQRLIRNIATIENRKFHIRAYFMVANYYQPFILLYGGAVIYIAGFEYEHETTTTTATAETETEKKLERHKIITNRAVSSKHDTLTENLWNLTSFGSYIDRLREQNQFPFNQTIAEYASGEQFIEQQLVPHLKSIARYVWLAAKNDAAMSAVFQAEFNAKVNRKMNYEANVQHYDLLAMDLLMDTDLELKLMEVQSGPMSSFVCDRCANNWDFDYESESESESDLGEKNDNTDIRYWACDFGQQITEESINIQLELQMKKKLQLPIVKEKFKSLHYWQPIIWQN